ncbi:hypothetical protein [Pseudomonas sp. CM27]|uniref:hypothetical protein n=1 Tax=Pseudomonas sp. CM27 TaxID=2738452 RepID=UPI001553E357|nr:hypothetical protein [Pseudomonas sp. CM27]NQD74517.1 hypothetical protein [Pseudomonas sp. CM27]
MSHAKQVHYAYVASENLRLLEEEFAAGISAQLPDWESTQAPVSTRAGAVNVTFFIYRRAHVMMSHGLADKNYLTRRDPQRGFEINKYRSVCVPGDWLKRKLLNTRGVELSANQIKVVGWPRIDTLLAAQKKQLSEQTMADKIAKLSPFRKIKVLWAPTHNAESKAGIISSYPGILPYEDRLRALFDYDFSLHPNLRESKKPTFEKLIEADVVIADRGTLVYEAWALGKPVIFPSWLIGEGNLYDDLGSAESHIYHERLGLHANSFDEMVDMIREVKKPDMRTLQFMESYLPRRTLGRSYELIANCVSEVWESGNLRIAKKVMKPVQV